MAEAKLKREAEEKAKRINNEWPGYKNGEPIQGMSLAPIPGRVDLYNIKWELEGEDHHVQLLLDTQPVNKKLKIKDPFTQKFLFETKCGSLLESVFDSDSSKFVFKFQDLPELKFSLGPYDKRARDFSVAIDEFLAAAEKEREAEANKPKKEPVSKPPVQPTSVQPKLNTSQPKPTTINANVPKTYGESWVIDFKTEDTEVHIFQFGFIVSTEIAEEITDGMVYLRSREGFDIKARNGKTYAIAYNNEWNNTRFTPEVIQGSKHCKRYIVPDEKMQFCLGNTSQPEANFSFIITDEKQKTAGFNAVIRVIVSIATWKKVMESKSTYSFTDVNKLGGNCQVRIIQGAASSVQPFPEPPPKKSAEKVSAGLGKILGKK